MQNLQDLHKRVLEKLPTLLSEENLAIYKNSIFGKSGELTEILK